jgi:isopentenyldiphosphate isomerase
MREKRQAFDKNCQPLGKYYFNENRLPKNCCIMVVMIVIENYNGEFLIQKRSQFTSSPLTWAVTSGHPTFKETNVQGVIREVKEELGLDIKNDKIESFFKNCEGRVCREMFYCQKDFSLDELKLEPREVESVALFSKEKILEMIKAKQFAPHQILFLEKLFEWQKENMENNIQI